ncbi:hypothetical protein Dsin_000293 [Dipteronia sinensis]|uniref:Reverse transcriptase zinc-binding domain-containing protein n=1 Tax=Dipteronia sinensis TaxID=43782 RepID=A0AAE0EHX3_9ROSI|nr:hypothetical protein Dsin_000293 [Dipteronia sinensis]
MHWCTWDRLCKPKVDRGLGFRNLEIFNRAFLARQCWRVLKSLNCLAAKTLKGKEDMDAILSILISTSQAYDVLLWHYDKSGMYTIKSRYWLGSSVREAACSSGRGESVGWWKFLWEAPIPLKVKFFVWKACQDWLPTMHNLSCRGFVMVSCAQRIVTNYSPQVADAVAIYRGLQFAKNSGLGPIMVESDAASVVN